MTRFFVLSIITLFALASVSACGRRGALDAPSTAANQTGKAAPASVEDKPFVLDRLIQ